MNHKIQLARLAGLLIVACFYETTSGQTNSALPPEESTKTQSPSQIQNPAGKPPKLLPQGYIISGRDAKLVKLPEDNRWFIIFVDEKPDEAISGIPQTNSNTWWEELDNPDQKDPLNRPIEVLPNQTLSIMANILGSRNDTSVTFRIWGELTTYKNRNYINITDVGMLRLFGSVPPAPDDKKKITPQIMQNQLDMESTEIPGDETDQDAIPDALRKALLAIPRPRPMNIDEENASPSNPQNPPSPSNIDNQPDDPSVNANTVTATASWRDGDLIIDRAGRLLYVAEQNEWLFNLDSVGPNQAATPITIHPNLLLETMEKLWLQSNHRTQFRVSGVVTVHQNRPYLLLRKMQVVYEQGNLSP